jgi:tRNA-splicing ligase RtcB
MWLARPLESDVKNALDRVSRCPDVTRVAVMPDVHLSRDVCVGTVVATRRLLYPGAVGGDIGCGMAAVAFDAGADVLASAEAAGRLLEELRDAVPSNRQRAPRDLPAGLAGAPPLSQPALESMRRRDARVQLGTLGRGNHFVEFQADDDGRLWLMVHTGSRGIGQAIRDHHLALARGAPLPSLDAEDDRGRAYLADSQWAIAYARANRDAIVTAVARGVETLLGVRVLSETHFDCCHNFVRRESHGGAEFWVHRKGANSGRDGEAGIIPGSMGTLSYHVSGRGEPSSLCSSSHGAGRVMSRDEARRCIGVRRLEREMGGVWFDRGTASRLCDEAPGAYQDLRAVMRSQRDLVRVVRRLRPVLSYKGP